MQLVLIVSILVIAAGAAVYLYRVYRAWRNQATLRRQVNDSIDLSKDPETPWVEILKKARTQMPADEYEKFESAVLMLVNNIGVVNRSGLTTQAEKMALLEKLNKLPADSHE